MLNLACSDAVKGCKIHFKAVHGQDCHKEFEYSIGFYGSDFQSSRLGTQLQRLSFKSCGAKESAISFKDVCNYMQLRSVAQRSLYHLVTGHSCYQCQQ